jgi:16S rRNA (guanine966-N2)-methyltransferase
MRIVGGKFAGRDLTSPTDRRIRPTAEHVRACLLEALEPDLAGREAISRGARTADFVEFRPASLHALRANVAALRLRERTRIFKRDAIPFAAALDADSYDIAFADPPYESRVLDHLVDGWRERRFSRILAVEHARTHRLPKGEYRQSFQESMITIYRV